MANFTLLVDSINAFGTNTIGYLDTNDTLLVQTGVIGADAYVFGDDSGLVLDGGTTADKGAWNVTVT